YKQLEALEPDSSVIRLNRIISESYVHNSEKLINEIMELESHFPRDKKYALCATKGDLYQRMGKMDDAQKAYWTAIECSKSQIDIELIKRKIRQCRDQQGRP